MLLGKRTRPPMKRTTSMTEFTLDFAPDGAAAYQPFDPHNPLNGRMDQQQLLASAQVASPRLLHRRASADFVETAPFLKSCSLCDRRLIPGRDIYMYRGDSGFCSLECRQQQMNQDERKEKISLASKIKKEATNTAAAAGQPQVTTAGKTLAAV